MDVGEIGEVDKPFSMKNSDNINICDNFSFEKARNNNIKPASSTSSFTPVNLAENGFLNINANNPISNYGEELVIETVDRQNVKMNGEIGSSMIVDDFSDNRLECPSRNYFNLPTLRNEIYENNDGQVIARILGTKAIYPDSVNVTFFEKHFEVRFKTSDEKFLHNYKQTSETFFVWKPKLCDFIIPDGCTYGFKRQILEITLVKKNKSKMWYSLTEITKTSVNDNDTERSYSTDGEAAAPHSSKGDSNGDTRRVGICDNQAESSRKEDTLCGTYYRLSPGFTGLLNLGNTCFMNATLQILLNTNELRAFFLEDLFRTDLNVTNILGFHGELAEAFADLAKRVWKGNRSVCATKSLKELIERKYCQFADGSQHDAQEFLSFLLDGLHEDLNRVVDKHLVADVESDGRPDQVLAELSWLNYKARNDSLIVDLFHGQLKSRLLCPDCSTVSIKFDPFVYLPVAFPKVRKKLSVYYWPADIEQKPRKHTLLLSEDDNVLDMKLAISRLEKCDEKYLRVIATYEHSIFKHYENITRLRYVNRNNLYVFNVSPSSNDSDDNSDLYEIDVVQKVIRKREKISRCSYCNVEKPNIRACLGCYQVGYCNRNCQQQHWNVHKISCKQFSYELIGEPFILSSSTKDVKLSTLFHHLAARALLSVTLKDNDQIANNGDYNFSFEDTKICNRLPRAVSNDSYLSEKSDAFTINDHIRPTFSIQIRKTSGAGFFEYSTKDGDVVLDLSEISNGELSIIWRNRDTKWTVENKSNLVCEIVSCAQDATEDETSEELKLCDLLRCFTETEKLNPQEAWRCNVCKKNQEAEKTMRLWKIPPIFIIQLKRFSFAYHDFRSKTKTFVRYPVKGLDLKDYLCDGALRQCTVYDLYGVVCHKGSSRSGHYLSYGRLLDSVDSEKECIGWRQFDDNEVMACGESDVINDDAYLLFYHCRESNVKRLLDTYRSNKQCLKLRHFN